MMSATADRLVHIVGIGGTTKAGSSTEKALAIALAECERQGASTTLIGGGALARLPVYSPENAERSQTQCEFADAVRHADGIILATPAYHGGMSGLLKNAIDTLEDLRSDPRPYVHDRAVGCIVTANGWQGAGTTLTSVRTIVHALRGWPTPLGITINTAEHVFDERGGCVDQRLQAQIAMVAAQVVGFALKFRE
jgi:FMN reductase